MRCQDLASHHPQETHGSLPEPALLPSFALCLPSRRAGARVAGCCRGSRRPRPRPAIHHSRKKARRCHVKAMRAMPWPPALTPQPAAPQGTSPGASAERLQTAGARGAAPPPAARAGRQQQRRQQQVGRREVSSWQAGLLAGWPSRPRCGQGPHMAGAGGTQHSRRKSMRRRRGQPGAGRAGARRARRAQNARSAAAHLAAAVGRRQHRDQLPVSRLPLWSGRDVPNLKFRAAAQARQAGAARPVAGVRAPQRRSAAQVGKGGEASGRVREQQWWWRVVRWQGSSAAVVVAVVGWQGCEHRTKHACTHARNARLW